MALVKNIKSDNNRQFCLPENLFRSYAENREKYLKYLTMGRELSLLEKIEMINNGRTLANYLGGIYSETSQYNVLSNIKQIYDDILPLYPDKIYDDEEVNEAELALVRDHCKNYVHKILILVHMNRFNEAFATATAFNAHLSKFEKYVNSNYRTLFHNAKELLFSYFHIKVLDDKGRPINIGYRLGLQAYEIFDDFQPNGLKLHKAIIVGASATQAELSKHTIDMLRMSHAIESSPELASKIKNARKFTFYNPRFWDLDIGINDALFHISRRGIMLLYVSGDEYEMKNSRNNLYKYGVKMKQLADGNIEHLKVECLYPGDVAKFLVVPTILVIDSECAHSFQELDNYTEEPFLCLLSPAKYPTSIVQNNRGKLFTAFLSLPQSAFCWICGQFRISQRVWNDLSELLNKFMFVCWDVIKKYCLQNPKEHLTNFMADHYCRSLLMRYLFCLITLRLHEQFNDEMFYPRSNQIGLESHILATKQLHTLIYKMAATINSSDCFAVSNDLSLSNQSIDVGV